MDEIPSEIPVEQARGVLGPLVRAAATGHAAPIITLRGSKPARLIAAEDPDGDGDQVWTTSQRQQALAAAWRTRLASDGLTVGELTNRHNAITARGGPTDATEIGQVRELRRLTRVLDTTGASTVQIRQDWAFFVTESFTGQANAATLAAGELSARGPYSNVAALLDAARTLGVHAAEYGGPHGELLMLLAGHAFPVYLTEEGSGLTIGTCHADLSDPDDHDFNDDPDFGRDLDHDDPTDHDDPED